MRHLPQLPLAAAAAFQKQTLLCAAQPPPPPLGPWPPGSPWWWRAGDPKAAGAERGGAGRGAELSASTRPGPLFPRSSPTQRPISQNDSRSGHPKFSGAPNFGRCSGDNCYYWALRCSQSQLHGSIPIKPITLNPLQSRLLESPRPAPATVQNLVELRGTALPGVGRAAYLSSVFTKPKAKNLGACSPNRWLPEGRSPGHHRGCSLQGSENKNQGAKRKPGRKHLQSKSRKSKLASLTHPCFCVFFRGR